MFTKIEFEISGRIEAHQDAEALDLIRSQELKWNEAVRTHVVINLRNCESLNLRVIMELARWADKLKANQGEMIFLGPSVGLKRSLDIFVGVHRIRHISNPDELELLTNRNFFRDSRVSAWQSRLFEN